MTQIENYVGDIYTALIDGKIYVGTWNVCMAMGLPANMRKKLQGFLRTDATLKTGCIDVTTGAKKTVFQAIRIDLLPLWLGKIDVTDADLRTAPKLYRQIQDMQQHLYGKIMASYQTKYPMAMAPALPVPVSREGRGAIAMPEMEKNIQDINAKLEALTKLVSGSQKRSLAFYDDLFCGRNVADWNAWVNWVVTTYCILHNRSVTTNQVVMQITEYMRLNYGLVYDLLYKEYRAHGHERGRVIMLRAIEGAPKWKEIFSGILIDYVYNGYLDDGQVLLPAPASAAELKKVPSANRNTKCEIVSPAVFDMEKIVEPLAALYEDRSPYSIVTTQRVYRRMFDATGWDKAKKRYLREHRVKNAKKCAIVGSDTALQKKFKETVAKMTEEKTNGNS